MTKAPKKTTPRPKAVSKGVAAARAVRTVPAESTAFKEGREAALSGHGPHTNPHKQHPERLDWANGFFSQTQGV